MRGKKRAFRSAKNNLFIKETYPEEKTYRYKARKDFPFDTNP